MSERDEDDGGRAFQSGSRTPTDQRARRALITSPEGIPVVLIDDPQRARSDTGERRIAAEAAAEARAEVTLEHRLRMLEDSHAWVRRGLAAVGMAALASLGGVISKIWAAGEATTTERVLLQRSLEDIKDLRDEVRMLRRSSDLLPDRASTPVANLSRAP